MHQSKMSLMLNCLIVLCLALLLNGIIYAYPVIMISLRNENYSQKDIGYEIGELQIKYGYPFENHTVTTEDGYILEMHRIPFGKKSTNTTNRPAILLAHGLLGSSAQWLLGGVDKNLPDFLADRGYDVWIPNARGNVYSRKHISLNPDKNKREFFDFSWNEIGYYDWPAAIDYVISVTKQKKIFYIGHSQGCVTFYTMMSERPEYNEKIRLMVALAPVVYTTGIKSFIFQVPAFFQNTFEWLAEKLDVNELMPLTKYSARIADTLCNENSIFQGVCVTMLGLTGGFYNDNLNKTILPVMVAHTPSGASMKQLLHYTQILNSDVFQKYDYGETKNIDKYNQTTPPLYNLDNVKTPVIIYYSNNDWVTTERNILKLASELPNVVHLKKVDDKHFTHFDFVFSINAADILYPDIVDKMSLY